MTRPRGIGTGREQKERTQTGELSMKLVHIKELNCIINVEHITEVRYFSGAGEEDEVGDIALPVYPHLVICLIGNERKGGHASWFDVRGAPAERLWHYLTNEAYVI
jgi:hypothetical protein